MLNKNGESLPPPSKFIPPDLLKVKPKKETKRVFAAKPEVILPEYVITLTIGKEVSEGRGTSMLEALRNLKKPAKITTKSSLRIEFEGKKKEMYYTPVNLKRVFYPMAQGIMAKTFAMALK